MAASTARSELDRQIDRLVELGYPALAGLGEQRFRETLAPLADVLPGETTSTVPADDRIPFVLVVTAVAPADAAALMTRDGNPAELMLRPDEIARFTPIEGVDVPSAAAYLLVDVDTGSQFCNVRPVDALPRITGQGRTPLTIAEGVAVVTQRPDMLRKNKCFSLLGSRCGDKRVPAIWISGRAPKLGWCWAGNPHTWLGAASAAARR